MGVNQLLQLCKQTAGGNPQKLQCLRYNAGAKKWIALPTQVDLVIMKLTCQTTSFSLFAVAAVDVEATPTATPITVPTPIVTPPKVGDVAPSSLLLLGALIAGTVLVLAGLCYLRQAGLPRPGPSRT